MEAFIAVAFLAGLGERLSEVLLKPFLAAAEERLTRVVCAIPGFVLALLAGYDVFVLIGIQFPVVQGFSLGILITALVTGLGSSFVHDTFQKVRS